MEFVNKIFDKYLRGNLNHSYMYLKRVLLNCLYKITSYSAEFLEGMLDHENLDSTSKSEMNWNQKADIARFRNGHPNDRHIHEFLLMSALCFLVIYALYRMVHGVAGSRTSSSMSSSTMTRERQSDSE